MMVVLVGCTNNIRVPLDPLPLSSTDSTIIVWMDQKPILINDDSIPILIDGVEVGSIGAKRPLKIKVTPGHHKLYASMFGLIDRAIEVDLSPGRVYFYRTYVKIGMWVSSVYTTRIGASTYYDSVIHKFRDN